MILITKTKIYIDNPTDAPKGVKVEEGERGGLYYESTSSQELPSQDKFQERTYEQVYGKEIEIIDAPKEIVDRYIQEKQTLNRPIPSNKMKEMIFKAISPIQNEIQGNKIYLIPYSMDCWGFADPTIPNTIFIPQYDIGFTEQTIYDIYGFKDLQNRLDKVLLQDEKKIFNDWKTLTQENAIQKTLMHEKGHIDTYNLIEQKSGKKEYTTYWKPIPKYTENGKYIEGWDYSNIEFFFKLFKDYIEYPEVLERLNKYDDVRVKAYQLGEFIAEDIRLIKGGKQSLFPNQFFYYSDLTMPFTKERRHEALKKVFGW